MAAFASLNASFNALQRETDLHGVNSVWLFPSAHVRQANTSLSVLLTDIEATLNAADIINVSD